MKKYNYKLLMADATTVFVGTMGVGEGLGQWKESRLDGIVTVCSGVYWLLLYKGS